MSKWAKQYRKSAGEHGTWVIEETGLCTHDEATDIERGCTKRYIMVPLPQAVGAIMKVLDGTRPSVVSVTPLTYSKTYRCVKVAGQVEPFAPVQDGGTYDGYAVLSYTIKYQEVHDVV